MYLGETLRNIRSRVLLKRLSISGRAAVIDSIVVQHTKPINVYSGSYYQMLRREFIYPELELRHLQALYRVDASFHEVTWP